MEKTFTLKTRIGTSLRISIFALFYLFYGHHMLSAQACTHTDYSALETFFYATGGSTTWNENSNWLANCEPCTGNWKGIICNSNNRVIALDLSNQNLSGVLPPEIGELTLLEKLELSQNNIGGEIPSVLGFLPQLKVLNLGQNQLNSSIPSELGGLSFLDTLIVSNNTLTGTVPVEIGNLFGLKYMDLSYNNLSGDLPSSIGYLPNLQTLFLSNNDFESCVPGSFSLLCSSDVDISDNPELLGGGDFVAFCQSGVGNCYLPLELLSFQANNQRNTIVLTWTTTKETNIKGFELQRKNIKGFWESLNFISAVGSSTSMQEYSFTDTYPYTGTNYYRLKIEENNGETNFSEVINIFRNVPQATIHPNPVKDNLYFNLSFEKGHEAILNVKLFNLQGKEIRKWNSISTNELDLEQLSEGKYVLQITDTETSAFWSNIFVKMD